MSDDIPKYLPRGDIFAESASVGCTSSAGLELPAPSLHTSIIISTTLTKINRGFAVDILIQARGSSKAALFGRKSSYPPYDLVSMDKCGPFVDS